MLADCYRAQKRWTDVENVWNDVKKASPPHDVMAEARIVVASSLADRGDLARAIELMEPAQQAPKRVRYHHLRQWYVLADLYDRAGDTVSAHALVPADRSARAPRSPTFVIDYGHWVAEYDRSLA